MIQSKTNRLILMIAIIVIAVAIVVCYRNRTREIKLTAAKAQVLKISRAVLVYNVVAEMLPSDLNALFVGPEDGSNWVPAYEGQISDDPWGSPFRYTSQAEEFEIRSAGPDRKFDTSDDIFETANVRVLKKQTNQVSSLETIAQSYSKRIQRYDWDVPVVVETGDGLAGQKVKESGRVSKRFALAVLAEMLSEITVEHSQASFPRSVTRTQLPSLSDLPIGAIVWYIDHLETSNLVPALIQWMAPHKLMPTTGVPKPFPPSRGLNVSKWQLTWPRLVIGRRQSSLTARSISQTPVQQPVAHGLCIVETKSLAFSTWLDTIARRS